MNQRPLAAIPLTCPVGTSCGGDTPLYSNLFYGNGGTENLHIALDLVGASEIPGVSQAADILSGALSFASGDHVGGALSLGAATPVIGNVFAAMKWSRRGANALEHAREMGRAGERLAGLTGAAKKAIDVDGRKLFPDEVDKVAGVLKESKNVAKQSYTRQLRSYTKYSKDNGFKFELWTRRDTKLSKPLQKAIADGHIIHKCYLGPCL